MKRKLKKYADERLGALNNPERLESLKAYRQEIDEGNSGNNKKLRIGFISALSACVAVAVVILCICLIVPMSGGNNNSEYIPPYVSSESLESLNDLNAKMKNFEFVMSEKNSLYIINKDKDSNGNVMFYTITMLGETDFSGWEFIVVIDKNFNYEFMHLPYDMEENIGAFKISYSDAIESNSSENLCKAEIVTDEEKIYVTGKGAQGEDFNFIEKVKEVVKLKP